MKIINQTAIFLLVILFMFSASFAFAEGSIPNTGYRACAQGSEWPNYKALPPNSDPIALCQQMVTGSTIGSTFLVNSSYRGACGMGANGTYTAYQCDPYTNQAFVFRLNSTICSANSTFNGTTQQCDCATGYEPNQAGTACEQVQETQQTCEAQGKYWNAINSTCFDNVCQSLADGQTETELTVLVTSDAGQTITVNPQLFEYGFFNGCRYYMQNLPTTSEQLNCFTLQGDVEPKDGFCNFDYVATGQNSSQSGDANLLADASANADNEVCEGNAEKNDFGMCMEDTTVECDPETEWHNYGNNTCEPKQECNANQEYFSNETIQGCQDLACPAGEFRTGEGQPCQPNASCTSNQTSYMGQCYLNECASGYYRINDANECIPVPDDKIRPTCSWMNTLGQMPSECMLETGVQPRRIANTNNCSVPSNLPHESGLECEWAVGGLTNSQGLRQPSGLAPHFVTFNNSASCPQGTSAVGDGTCLPDICTSDPNHSSCPDDTGDNGSGNGDNDYTCPEGEDCSFNGEDLDGKLDGLKTDYANKINQIKGEFSELFTPLEAGTADLPIYKANITVGNKQKEVTMDTSSGTMVFDKIGTVVLLMGGILSVFIVLRGLVG